MLIRTFFLLLLIGAVAETIVGGAGALAKATLHHRAVAAAGTASNTAITLAQQTIAAAIARGTDPAAGSFGQPPSTSAVRRYFA